LETQKTEQAAYFTLEPERHDGNQRDLQIGPVNPEPVLKRGAPGTWDSVDVLNPSVVRFRGKLANYYSGYDGSVWRTGLALSQDGLLWEKSAQNPLLAPGNEGWDRSFISANGSAIINKDRVYYYFQGLDSNGLFQIGLASSEDGVAFKKALLPVLSVGPEKSWDSGGVADPYVIEHAGVYYMYYLGQDSSLIQKLGLARSRDGIKWEKYAQNPVLDVGARGTFDSNGLGEPSVIYSASFFYMIYTGRDALENRDLGYALSPDGVHWKKRSSAGLFSSGSLRQEWNSQVVCDTTILQDNDSSFRVWFGGGDKPAPAQKLNGQIGIFILHLNQ